MGTWMGGLGFLFMLLYFAVVVAIVAVIVLTLWRSMRAQEDMARTLSRIEEVLARRSEPPA